jgi:hypothetical protein
VHNTFLALFKKILFSQESVPGRGVRGKKKKIYIYIYIYVGVLHQGLTLAGQVLLPLEPLHQPRKCYLDLKAVILNYNAMAEPVTSHLFINTPPLNMHLGCLLNTDSSVSSQAC